MLSAFIIILPLLMAIFKVIIVCHFSSQHASDTDTQARPKVSFVADLVFMSNASRESIIPDKWPGSSVVHCRPLSALTWRRHFNFLLQSKSIAHSWDQTTEDEENSAWELYYNPHLTIWLSRAITHQVGTESPY